MVPKRGLEPLRAKSPLDPESSASTNSTTSAKTKVKRIISIINIMSNIFIKIIFVMERVINKLFAFSLFDFFIW